MITNMKTLKEWAEKANETVKSDTETIWFSGDTCPVHEGWYDRYFSDGIIRHWWDGKEFWWVSAGVKNWHQVGAYPCWRGRTTRYIPKPVIINWDDFKTRCTV